MKVGSVIKVIKLSEEYLHLPPKYEQWSEDEKEFYDNCKQVRMKCIGREYVVDEVDDDGQLWILVDDNANPTDDFINNIAFWPHEVELIKE